MFSSTGALLATYHKALQEHAKNASLWYELGICHGSKKEWEPSLQCLQNACKFDPENRQYTNALGYCLARCGRYDESYACFRPIVGEARAHYNLARMLHHLNQDEQSKEQLRQALMAEPRLMAAAEMLMQLEGRVPVDQEVVPVGFEKPVE